MRCLRHSRIHKHACQVSNIIKNLGYATSKANSYTLDDDHSFERIPSAF